MNALGQGEKPLVSDKEADLTMHVQKYETELAEDHQKSLDKDMCASITVRNWCQSSGFL